jgi:hypothetical protein
VVLTSPPISSLSEARGVYVKFKQAPISQANENPQGSCMAQLEHIEAIEKRLWNAAATIERNFEELEI